MSEILLISAQEIEKLYLPLFQIGVLGEIYVDGFLRASWSPEEQQAFDYFHNEAQAVGLTARYDAVGNLFLEQAGFTRYVECGSHLDTTVRGGNFDGAAGIVAGFAAIRGILKSGIPLKKGLRLRIWRGEESGTYAIACKGSRAAFGNLPESILKTVFRGTTLAQAIRDRGFDTSPIENGKSTVTADEIDGIAAHLELHIEQANSLEQQCLDIGIVDSIRGPIRLKIMLFGRFDHSGGTPMGAVYRRDANLALAYTLVELDKLAGEAIAQGHDLVQTAGVINSDSDYNAQEAKVYQNGVAKVSGFAYFSLDIRSRFKSFRDDYTERALTCVRETAGRFGVDVEVQTISSTDPCETLDEGIKAAQLAAVQQLGYSAVVMPSGALHDCMHVNQQKRSDGTHVPIGMTFIPCREGISHAPDEFTSFEAVAKGANVLARSLAALAG